MYYRKRIGIVAPEYPPDIGGMQNYAFEVAGALSELGFQITVFTKKGEGDSKNQGNITVFRILEGSRRKDRIVLSRFIELIDIWYVMNAAWVWIALEVEPVLVSIYGNDFLDPNPVARFDLKKRFKLRKGDSIDFFLAKWWTRFLMQQGFKKVHHIVAISHYTRSIFLKKYPFCKNKVTVGFVGVGKEWFADCQSKVEEEKTARLITVCRLSEKRKNVHVVLKALAKLKDKYKFIYTVIGDGSFLSYYKMLSSELGLENNVCFLGAVDKFLLKKEICKSDLMILTSSESNKSVEGFGLVYLEANACGVPVVAARIGGVVDAVEEGVSGIFVDSPEVEQLTDVLEQILSKKIIFSRSACKEHAAKFTWTRVARHISNFFI